MYVYDSYIKLYSATTILESKNGNLHIFLNDFTFHESSLIISIYTDK